MGRFDQKFGADFLASVPTTPGVYEMLGPQGEVVYVGKAKSLRARLAQYRRATRRKVHAKMREVLAAAEAVRLTPCETELEALLLENQRILALRQRPPGRQAVEKTDVANAAHQLTQFGLRQGEPGAWHIVHGCQLSDQVSFVMRAQGAGAQV